MTTPTTPTTPTARTYRALLIANSTFPDGAADLPELEGELAHDARLRNHASLFTHHMAEAIRHGAPDGDGDGLVTLSEIYDHVHAALVGEGRAVPQKAFSGDGDVALARRPPRAAASGPVTEAAEAVVAGVGAARPRPVDPGRRPGRDRGRRGAAPGADRGGQPGRRQPRLDGRVQRRVGRGRARGRRGGAPPPPGPGTDRANVYVRDGRTGPRPADDARACRDYAAGGAMVTSAPSRRCGSPSASVRSSGLGGSRGATTSATSRAWCGGGRRPGRQL